METGIPLGNLYYLLCYAWERLEERDLIEAGFDTPPKDVLDLLGRVLVRVIKPMIRRGFERGYRDHTEELALLRGRIDVGATLRRSLLWHGRAACSFDELDHDTPANRIIRATLTKLIVSRETSEDLRHDASGLRRHFGNVSSVDVSIHDLRRIVVHRNNRHYAFALLLCEKILAMLMPDERGDSGRFRDFTRDHGAMARLFEKFVRNFYDHHRGRCGLTSVASQRIDWANTAHEAEATRWPGMLADVCIRRKVGSPLVIDCKFYHDVLKETSQGKEVLSSANLYQIFSYTQNLRTLPGWEHTDGMLLYAENGTSVDEEQVVLGTRLRVVTLNLNQPWNEIEARLLKLVQHRQILRAGA